MHLKCRAILLVSLCALYFLSAAAAGYTAEIPAMPANPVVDLAGIIDDSC